MSAFNGAALALALVLAAVPANGVAVLEPQDLNLLTSAAVLQPQDLALLSSATGDSVSISLEKRKLKPAGMGLIQRGNDDEDDREMHKEAYFGKIHVGNPKQKFDVVYDTGSANLIVPEANCPSQACKKHDTYNPKKSKSMKMVNCDGSKVGKDKAPDGVKISFGTGHITGACFEDKVCVGIACNTGMFISSMQETDHPFATFEFDGVLGLSLPVMAQGAKFSLLERLVKHNTLKQPIFSVFLSNSDDEVSEVTFGEIKLNHVASKVFFEPVSRHFTGYWEVRVKDITLDNKPQKMCRNCYVAVDTGTSELAGPSDLVSKLATKLGLNSDCSNFHKMPNVGFVVGKHIVNLEPDDYIDKDASDTQCSLALMKLDVPPPKGPLFVFGIPFLQKYLTVYDLPKKRVGFAVAKHKGVDEKKGNELLVQMDEQPDGTLDFAAAGGSGGSSRNPLRRHSTRRH